jgi:hypothetical protein
MGACPRPSRRCPVVTRSERPAGARWERLRRPRRSAPGSDGVTGRIDLRAQARVLLRRGSPAAPRDCRSVAERSDVAGAARWLAVVRLTVMDADALSTTPVTRAALATLRDLAGANGAMERHCLRQFLIAERLAGDREYDRELLLCACWLHDLGLFTDSRDPYVTEGARLAARVLEPFDWPPERLQRCMDACEQHHAPRSRMALGLEVELVRRADLVDVTAGLVNFGLDRGWLRKLFREVTRDGLWRLIGSAVLHELRHRPTSLTHVFLSPRRTRPRTATAAPLFARNPARARPRPKR